MNADAWIIDGYVDEPACLGVPPYISPYIRTVAGVLIDHEYSPGYCTIDQIRTDYTLLRTIGECSVVVMIAGVTVPGKYLGGTPAGYSEIRQIGSSLRKPTSFLGGPILLGSSSGGGIRADRAEDYGFGTILPGNPATDLYLYLKSGEVKAISTSHNYQDYDHWALTGAGIVSKHPFYPLVLCEIETARGCSHAESGGCSFCTEPFYGKPVFRSAEGTSAEIAALYASGIRHFRLGRQPDLLTYQAKGGEFPKPEPEALDTLFSEIRAVAPNLKTLHIDNINPGTIARHPDSAREALEIIVKYHTPGDVAAFGMETADPAVIEACNLKGTPDMMMDAIRIVNEVGGIRSEGIPHLLPGLNFIAGLCGETSDTYRLNYEFLQNVLKKDLFIRRVNIRQLMPFEGTRAWNENCLPIDIRQFHQFKEMVRKTFDLPMLRKVFPTGTVVRDVIIEEEGSPSFGRQLGSYPILIGFPMHIPIRTVLDAVIVDHGMRSVTALPWPIPINTIPAKVLPLLPGVTKKNQVKILAKRPFQNNSDLERLTGVQFPPNLLTFVGK